MKKIIIITALLLFPFGVFAKENWKLNERKNVLSIEGECQKKASIKIELYSVGKGEPVYSSGAVCGDGKFEFSDNLLQWKNLTDGDYEVVVDGDVKNIENIKIERPVQESVSHENIQIENANVNAVKKEEVKSPEIKFLGAFITLQQTILDMRNWLAETKYPSFVKTSIGIALSGVDLAVGRVSELVLSTESLNVEQVDKAEILVSVTEPQKVEENVTAVEQDQDVSVVNVSNSNTDEIAQ